MSSTRSSKNGSNKKETNLLVLDRETHTPSVLVGLLKETLSKFKKIGGNKFDASVRGRATFLEQTFKKSLENGVSPKIINEARTDCIIGFYNSVINRDKTRQKINGGSPRGSPRVSPHGEFLLRTESAFSKQCRSLIRSGSTNSTNSNTSAGSKISTITGTGNISRVGSFQFSPRCDPDPNVNDMLPENSGDSEDSLGFSRENSTGSAGGYITPPASPRFKRAAISPATRGAIIDYRLFLEGRSPRIYGDSLPFMQDTPRFLKDSP
jgi:hypothetical protein